MKIYHVGPVHASYDGYSDFVVIAEDPDKARQFCDDEARGADNESFLKAPVTYLGPANSNLCKKYPSNIICYSFHAG